jgi:hypothetical protein
MINANELRIGNLIYNQGKGISRRITTVSGNIILERTKGKMKLIEPIPLTEEWLLKCGGIDKDYTIEFKCKGKKIVFSWFSREVISKNRHGWNSKKYKHIKYVHQLQNLYFALTNEELTMK